MVLAVPRCVVTVLLQDFADGDRVSWDNAVVTGIAGRLIDHDAGAHRVMVAAGEQSGPSRRTERCRMERGVAQAHGVDAVERRRRDYATECARSGEAHVVGHDQQHIGRALRRHSAGRPVRLGLSSVDVDVTLELLRRGRQIAAINRRCRAR